MPGKVHEVTIVEDNEVEPKAEDVAGGDFVKVINDTSGSVDLEFPTGHPFTSPEGGQSVPLPAQSDATYEVRGDVAPATEFKIGVKATGGQPESSPRIRIITTKRSS